MNPLSLAHTQLASLPFLTPDEVAALGDAQASRRTERAGQDLAREGQSLNRLLLVLDGWACRYTTAHDGRLLISGIVLPGEICNIDILMFDQPDFGVRMLSAGSVLSIPRDRVLELAAAHPGIDRAITWLAMVENAMLTRNAMRLGRYTARERVAHLLCELHVRLGGSADTGEAQFDLPMTQEHIADVLGLTPVHVNRSLRWLRTDGLLASSRGTIVIPDIAALRRAADFDPAYLHRTQRSDLPWHPARSGRQNPGTDWHTA